jgi:hypothetical protein
MEQHIQTMMTGIIAGFAMSTLAGLATWGISAVCRLIIKLTSSGR